MAKNETAFAITFGNGKSLKQEVESFHQQTAEGTQTPTAYKR